MAMKKNRRKYPAGEIVGILRQHLLEKVPVSDLCDKYGFQPLYCSLGHPQTNDRNGCRNHLATSYPRSNGKLKRYHKTIKGTCLRVKTPLSLEDAKLATAREARKAKRQAS